MSKLKQRNDVTAEIMVGAFMFTIMAVLLVVTVLLSQNKLFEKSYAITATFPSVGGLRVGEEVFLRGVKIGFVEAIEFHQDEEGVFVDMELTRNVKLYEEYKISVETASMLGGMRVMISEGNTGGEPLAEEKYTRLVGSPPENVLAMAGDAIEEINKSLVGGGTLENLQMLSKNMADISTKINNGQGTLGRLVTEDDLYDSAQELMAGLNNTADNFESVAARINRGEGTLGKLLAEDDRLYTDLQATAANFRKISQDLADGKGVIGKLMSSDDTFYEDLKESVSSLKEFSEDLASQEGTVGRLIQDETLYLKVVSLVDEARASIDDFRETSPITTFSSIFFGAF